MSDEKKNANLTIAQQYAGPCDFTLIVGTTRCKFYSHKSVLAEGSPVFRAMFESGMKEALKGEVSIIDAKPEVFEEFLIFLYDAKPPTFISGVQSLLELGHKYEVSSLVFSCENELVSSLESENAAERLILANFYGLDALKKSCILTIRDNIRLVVDTTSWIDIVNNFSLVTSIAQSFSDKNPLRHAVTPADYMEMVTARWTFSAADFWGNDSWCSFREVNFPKDDLRQNFVLCLSKSTVNRRCAMRALIMINRELLRYSDKLSIDCLAVVSSVKNEEPALRKCIPIRFTMADHGTTKQVFACYLGYVTNGISVSLTLAKPGCLRIVDNISTIHKSTSSITLKRSADFSDIIIITEGQQFPAHKFLLSQRSMYFARLFGKNKYISEFEMEGISSKSLEVALNHMYSEQLPSSTEVDEDLIHAAMVLELTNLLEYCRRCIELGLSPDNAIETLCMGERLCMDSVTCSSLEFISKNIDNVIASSSWKTLRKHPNLIIKVLLTLSDINTTP